jgi:hypothetical protein
MGDLSVKVRVGWERVPRSRQTRERERERESPGGSVADGTRREREKEKFWCLDCAACRLLLDRFSGGFGEGCRAVDTRERERERAKRDSWGICRGRDERRREREREEEKLWSWGCAACRLLLDRFSGGFGGTGWTGWTVHSQGLKKRRGKTKNEFFQNLHSFPNSGKTSLLNKQTNNLFYLGEDESFMTTTN